MKVFRLAILFALGISLVSAAGVTYACDQTPANDPDTYAAGTCTYLNSTIAQIYNTTFTDANATILVEQGSTGLGGSVTADNYLPFSQYLTALTATASHDAVDTSALASLSTLDTAVYGSDNVIVTNALAGALGFTATDGVDVNFNTCVLGNAGCYDGVIILALPTDLPGGQSLYYRQQGGTQPSNSYDVYSVVEHETDEILGTSSCMDTQGSTLSDPCDAGVGAAAGTGTPSAVDLFRYNGVGQIAANNAYIGLSSAASGANYPYFSYNGGLTNGADGALYNAVSNGDDYADFTSSCAHVQDGIGCLGKGFDITNDGNSEINILDAVGFNLAVPEPGTWILLAAGLAVLLLRRRFSSVTRL